MGVLLLSAYHSASHRCWCEGLMAALPGIDWTLRFQSARYFCWRERASGWQWALGDDPASARPYDLVPATSLTSVLPLPLLSPLPVPTWATWAGVYQKRLESIATDKKHTPIEN